MPSATVTCFIVTNRGSGSQKHPCHALHRFRTRSKHELAECRGSFGSREGKKISKKFYLSQIIHTVLLQTMLSVDHGCMSCGPCMHEPSANSGSKGPPASCGKTFTWTLCNSLFLSQKEVKKR